MKFLVDMKLRSPFTNPSPAKGAAFIENVIFPTLERCLSLQAEGKIVAGGAASGEIRLILMVETQTPNELEETIMPLAIWPLAETTVIPLSTFDDRKKVVERLFESLNDRLKGAPS